MGGGPPASRGRGMGPKATCARNSNFKIFKNLVQYPQGYMDYKTSAVARAVSLAYYYEHREEVLARMEADRRARGVPARGVSPKRSREERLLDVLWCKVCGDQVKTPSLILQRATICRRCVRARITARNLAKGLTAKGTVRPEKVVSAVNQFKALKASLSCSRCGFSGKPECLDFHHRDPEAKEFTVSAKSRIAKMETLLVEIAKCDVLCANCHRTEHSRS
jgi:hypothetical protein